MDKSRKAPTKISDTDLDQVSGGSKEDILRKGSKSGTSLEKPTSNVEFDIGPAASIQKK